MANTTTRRLAAELAALGTRAELHDLRELLLADYAYWDRDAGERVLYDGTPPIVGRLLDALTIAETAVPARPVAPPVAAPVRDDNQVTGFATLQFSWGGLLDGEPTDNTIHLVRDTRRGTPGPTLCGIDRFAADGPGWSVGGGITSPDVVNVPCAGCVDAARRDYPGLTVDRGSTFSRVFADVLPEAVTSRG